MNSTRFLTLGAFLTFGLASGLAAQTPAPDPEPAEIPPASFLGNEYVDSQGCVFIRAGVSGNVTWVPRVNRDRQLICGQEPSLPRAAAAPAVAAATEAAATQASVTLPQAATQPVAVAEPEVEPVSLAAAPRAVKPAPRVTRQAAHVSRARVAQASVPAERRILPAHLQAERIAARGVEVPAGYAPVWEDDRLNPRRAEQTERGVAQTQRLWTNTVPRRLVDPARPQKVIEPRIISPAPGFAAKGRVAHDTHSR